MASNCRTALGTTLLLLALSCGSARRTTNNEIDPFELSIIHFSDFHSRYVPVAPTGGLCYEKEKCVGGIARLATAVRRLKDIRKNALLLNAGDCFQGTLYYDVYRGNITSYFMNKLPHDALVPGNHDYDDGVSGLAAFINDLKFPVIMANVDISNEPKLQNIFTNSTIIQKGGKNIGVIGVIYNDTDKMSSTTGKVKFLNEVNTINLESQKLKAKGIDIIIVLSHCGIEHDKIIATNCPDVDVIVGGHSHILLYNGKPPSGDVAYGEYPLLITQKKTNRNVLIVHAGAFTKYVGDIRILFNKDGEITNWRGNPIYLDKSIRKDPLISRSLKPWSRGVNKIAKKQIGITNVYLNGSCSTGECNFANLITDAMVDALANNVSVSLTSANNIQNSIPKGSITYEDVYMSLPYNNSWDSIELQGKDLLQILEENVARSSSNTSFVNHLLLHWSGMKVVYNLNNPRSKLVSARIRCSQRVGDEFEDIDENKIYRVAVQSYLTSQAYKTISKRCRNRVIGKTHDIENLTKYIKKIGTINVKTEQRMVFV